MKELLTIAFRNLLRQRRRSALTGSIIVLGVVFALFVTSFFNGMIEMLVRLTVESSIGAVQVHKARHLDSDEPLKLDMAEDEALKQRIARVPGVKAVAPRIAFEGLLNNGSTSSVVLVTAISPSEELAVCPGRSEVIGDTLLTTRSGDGVVLGRELAASLDLTPGRSATFQAPSKPGPSNALDATVSGFLDVKLPMMAKTVAVVPLDFAQSLLRMQGRVTEYAVAVDDLSAVEAVAGALATELGSDYDVQTWKQREPAASSGIARFNVIVAIVVIVLFLLVGSGLVNAMLMSVQERVREIGTMMAVGVKRRQILAIVIAEASVLALVASLVGSALGLLLVAWLHQRGVVFQFRGARPLEIYPFATAALVLKTVAGACVGAMVAAIYPARKAARLAPVDALRSV